MLGSIRLTLQHCSAAGRSKSNWENRADLRNSTNNMTNTNIGVIKRAGARFAFHHLGSAFHHLAIECWGKRPVERKPGPGSPSKRQGASSAGQREPTPHTHPPAIRPETNTILGSPNASSASATPGPGKPRQPSAHRRPQQGCVLEAEGPPASVTRRRKRRRTSTPRQTSS